jgi:glycosyltransferase involved in cell wall biosynthesis
MIKVSIITVNYNNCDGLKKTIGSVLEQKYENIEHIIIDGGSNDSSLEVIKSNADNRMYWVSEKDAGIYNAMNKGIKVSNGEYLLFLNSGDTLASSTTIQDICKELNGFDIVFGNLIINDYSTGTLKIWIKKYPEYLDFFYFINDTLPHSGGVFIKKTAFKEELGAYDEELKIVSDWKWFLLALFKYNLTYHYVATEIGNFDCGNGISSNHALVEKERAEVLNSDFKNLYRGLVNYWDFYNHNKKIISNPVLRMVRKIYRFVI